MTDDVEINYDEHGVEKTVVVPYGYYREMLAWPPRMNTTISRTSSINCSFFFPISSRSQHPPIFQKSLPIRMSPSTRMSTPARVRPFRNNMPNSGTFATINARGVTTSTANSSACLLAQRLVQHRRTPSIHWTIWQTFAID